MKTGTIYGLICPIAKKIVYVGQTTIPLKDKLSTSKAHTSGRYGDWIRDITTAGLLDKLEIVALERGVGEASLNLREEYWIRFCHRQSPLINKNFVPQQIKRGSPVASAITRYFIIDKALRTSTPTLKKLLFLVRADESNQAISLRTLQADLEDLRHNEQLRFFAPIVYSPVTKTYSYSDPNYSLLKVIEERFYTQKADLKRA